MLREKYLWTTDNMIQLLYIPWKDEGHIGRVKLQSPIILTSW